MAVHPVLQAVYNDLQSTNAALDTANQLLGVMRAAVEDVSTETANIQALTVRRDKLIQALKDAGVQQ